MIQGCWEAFCGTGLGSASAGFGWPQLAKFSPLYRTKPAAQLNNMYIKRMACAPERAKKCRI
jgi:hypothetical protein